MLTKAELMRCRKTLDENSLHGLNAIHYIKIEECACAEQIILICGVKLYIEYLLSLYVPFGPTHAQVLLENYTVLPPEVRFALEQQGCKLYLNMLGHGIFLRRTTIAKVIFFLRELARVVHDVKMQGDEVNEWVHHIQIPLAWDALSAQTRDVYMECAKSMTLDDIQFLERETKETKFIRETWSRPFIHFKMYGKESKSVKKSLTDFSGSTEERLLAIWEKMEDDRKLFYVNKASADRTAYTFTKRIKRSYDFRKRVRNELSDLSDAL